MSDKAKNIISNILGLGVFAFATYSLVYKELEITSFLILGAVGLGLFLFKNSTSTALLKKLINSKSE